MQLSALGAGHLAPTVDESIRRYVVYFQSILGNLIFSYCFYIVFYRLLDAERHIFRLKLMHTILRKTIYYASTTIALVALAFRNGMGYCYLNSVLTA